MRQFFILLVGAFACSAFPVLPKLGGEALAQTSSTTPSEGADSLRLIEGVASSFARLVLDCVRREYPNKPDHVANGDDDVRNPRSLHPAFHGCYDWHSAVHGHWMLVRLLELFPGLPEAAEIRTALNETLSPVNIASEVAYLDGPNRKSFERTYGWAWLLKLAEELRGWDDPDGRRWARNLDPLAQAIARRYEEFLPKQTYPIRTGVHPNTAFGIAFALDYATAVGAGEFRAVLLERAVAYYGNDRNVPAGWEPGGEDFLSPCLIEADLMRRVLSGKSFAEWFHAFLPGVAEGDPKSLFFPATVADRSDPKIVHLDGLNLSRAWCMAGIAAALPSDDPARRTLRESAARHARDALSHVASGSYEGEHWLATFAVYLLTLLEPRE
jgi:hypothetical protein